MLTPPQNNLGNGRFLKMPGRQRAQPGQGGTCRKATSELCSRAPNPGRGPYAPTRPLTLRIQPVPFSAPPSATGTAPHAFASHHRNPPPTRVPPAPGKGRRRAAASRLAPCQPPAGLLPRRGAPGQLEFEAWASEDSPAPPGTTGLLWRGPHRPLRQAGTPLKSFPTYLRP